MDEEVAEMLRGAILRYIWLPWVPAPRGPLRPLRGSHFVLSRPDRFATGAFRGLVTHGYFLMPLRGRFTSSPQKTPHYHGHSAPSKKLGTLQKTEIPKIE